MDEVAVWEMNERPHATTMHDSSGSHRSGSIGSAVETGVVTSGETGYRWPGRNLAGIQRERLVTVESARRLNPGNRAFAVIIRLYTGAGDHNIVQKGQARTMGGMWKIDMVAGRVFCTFKGSAGRAAIGSQENVRDHSWHTVRWERRSSGVTIVVDGGPTSHEGGEDRQHREHASALDRREASLQSPRLPV